MLHHAKPAYDIHIYFPFISGRMWVFLLVWVSFNGFAQLHVSENAVISVGENTTIYIAEETSPSSFSENTDSKVKPKIFITQNTRVYNFPSNSLVEIVFLENEVKSEELKNYKSKKTNKKSRPESKIKKPLTVDETDEQKEEYTFVFRSNTKTPATAFVSGTIRNVALVNTNLSVKLFQAKYRKENNYFICLLSADNLQIKEYFFDSLRKFQQHLEENITRPPPVFAASHSEIA